jgi:plastocyanin
MSARPRRRTTPFSDMSLPLRPGHGRNGHVLLVGVLLCAAWLLVARAVPAMARPLRQGRGENGRVWRVQVSAREFGFTLSRRTTRAGETVVELVNFGEDPHDLRLRRVGGTRVYRLATAAPGERSELDFRTRPGRYLLWCSIGDHRRRGMSALLTVG